jgi:hypothetical protein
MTGHPEILTQDLGTDISKYFGVAKIKVLPPRRLFHPVLPFRSPEGKLVFALCRKCVESGNAVKQTCSCTDTERMMTGIVTTSKLMFFYA